MACRLFGPQAIIWTNICLWYTVKPKYENVVCKMATILPALVNECFFCINFEIIRFSSSNRSMWSFEIVNGRYIKCKHHQHIETETKWLTFHRRHFQLHFFLDDDKWISINISLEFVLKGRNNNIPALAQIMAWYRPGTKPLSEPMLVILLMQIYRYPGSMG